MLYGAIAASEIKNLPPPEILSGAATFTGVGSLSVSASLTPHVWDGSANFAGAGEMAASGYIWVEGTVTLDPATKSATVTLSNGNLTVTHDDTSNNVGAKSTTSHSTGKYYWEVTAGGPTGYWSCIGGMRSDTSYADLVSNGTNCFEVYYFDSGNAIWVNAGATGYTLNRFVNGDVISIAFDFDNHLMWMRKNGGDWNGNGTADPATGVNGCTMPTGEWFAAAGFGMTNTGAGENFTFNFGGTSYAYTPPSGFGNW